MAGRSRAGVGGAESGFSDEGVPGRRGPAWGAAVLLLGLVVAGCGGDSGTDPGPDPDPPEQGSFSLLVAPTSLEVMQGESGTAAVTIARTGGFEGSVTLDVSGGPAGLTATASPSSASGTSATLTVAASATAAVGTHTLTVRGTASGQTERTATLQIAVTAAPPPPSADEVIIDLTACGLLRPIWLAFQDGSGPWTALSPTNQVYRFTVANDRGTLAYVLANSLVVHHLTAADIRSIGTSFCPPVPPTGTVTGTVEGMGSNDFAQIWLGGGYGSAAFPTSSFSLIQVQPGTHDLVAWRHNSLAEILGTPGNPDRGFIRRDVLVPGNGSVGVVDFEGDNSFDAAEAEVTVTGATADETLTHTMGYYTGEACLSSALYASSAPGGTIMTFRGVPASLQRPQDLHFLTVNGIVGLGAPGGYRGNRVAQELFRTLGDRTVALPPPLPTPVVGQVPGAYTRLQGTFTVPTAYSMVSLSYMATGAGRIVNLLATRDWFTGTDVTLTMPDLSDLAGWNPAWVPPTGASGPWTVTVNGNTLGRGSVCQEGGRIVTALEVGAF